MIKIWFEPHSITVDNEAKLASGWNDVDLSAEGIKRLNSQWPPRYQERKVDIVFASDMQRSYKCAVAIAKDKIIPIYVDSRLRECNYGDLTHKPKEEIDAMKAQCIDVPFPGGESYKNCMERMGSFLKDLKENFDGKTVVIIGHRATQYGLEHHINGKSILVCVTERWSYQPGWLYELE